MNSSDRNDWGLCGPKMECRIYAELFYCKLFIRINQLTCEMGSISSDIAIDYSNTVSAMFQCYVIATVGESKRKKHDCCSV